MFASWRKINAGGQKGPPAKDASALAFSFVLHLATMIVLGLMPIAVDTAEVTLVVQSLPHEQNELEIPDEFTFSDQPSDELGSSSLLGDAAALSMAPTISDFS